MSDIIGIHRFDCGNQVDIVTEIHDNGDKENNIYLNTLIKLGSYGNEASINLCRSQLTPDLLRRLANELDKAIATAQIKVHF